MKFNLKSNAFIGLVHLSFWLIYLCLLVVVIKARPISTIEAFSAATFSMISHALLVYIHLLFLLPVFYDRKAYLKYFIGFIICLLAISYLRVEIIWPITVYFFPWIDSLLEPRFSMAFLFNAIFVLLISIPLRLIKNTLDKDQLEITLKNQQLEAELRFLKAQVNPHFLFNALNNIYALAFIQSEKTPEMILKLSDMMSYMLYDCKEEKVKLSTEINYLENYLGLQQLKKDGEFKLSFEHSGPRDQVWISPMLFIPFFENAFKHGNLEDTEKGWLKSTLQVEDKMLTFELANTFRQKSQKLVKGGVGLENIQARLQLLYPTNHIYTQQSANNIFSIHLQLNLAES